MIVLALPVLAGALLCWPVRSATARLRAIAVPTARRTARRWRVRIGPLAVAGLGIAVLPFGGLGIAIAVVVTTATVRCRWRTRNDVRQRMANGRSIAEALRGLVAELRAGAHPAAAAESASADADGPAVAVLSDIATTARLGGEVDRALLRRAAETPALAPVLNPVAHAWSLAQRHGLPLADVLDSVRRDLEGRLRFAGQVQARMAGPRASGTVLVTLPAVAIVLGTLMGADPLRVLLFTGIGHTLLAIGAALACAGALWIARLTTRAVRP